MNIRKSAFRKKLYLFREQFFGECRAYSTIPVKSLQIVINDLDLQVPIKAMKIQRDTDPSRYEELLLRITAELLLKKRFRKVPR